MEIKEEVYVIMSKDRKLIAKGVPRNRYLCLVDGNDKKRILTYSSIGTAESRFKHDWFYTGKGVIEYAKAKYGEINNYTKSLKDDLEAVACTMIISE